MEGRSNRLVFLGTGTSSGIPVVGCKCPACTSTDPRDNRTRASVLLQTRPAEEAPWDHVMVDASIDLRQQLLREGSPLVSRVLFTHSHFDHFFGLDELRGVQFHTREPIEIYASQDVIDTLHRVYRHLFDESVQRGGGILKVEVHRTTERFVAGPMELVTLPAWHGRLPVQGYRWGNMVYLTDCSKIPEETWPLLESLDVLVLGMLRKRPHTTHFNLDQALEVVERLAPRRTYFVHMTHDISHSEINAELPPTVELAYDGLTIDLDPFDPRQWRIG